MDEVGKHLLADAGVARDEDGHIRFAHLQCHDRDLLHLRTLRDERVVLLLLQLTPRELALVALEQEPRLVQLL